MLLLHGYSICLFCSEKLLCVNIQSFQKFWYRHEDRKALLMTANSVANILTPGIFTSDHEQCFTPLLFFFLQWINLLVLINVRIQIYLICSYAFSCYFCLLFLWSCILPFVHEWFSGLALTGTSEVHVVQTNEAIGWSQEMLPTCSKINPMELVLYSSRVPIGEILTASGDPSLEVQPFSQLWLPGALLQLPCQTIPCVCTHKTECGHPEAWWCHI